MKFFIYQVITSNKFIKELQAIAEGRSGTFPQITFKEFGSIEINIPEIKHQRKISQIVSIIHQKETVNKEVISNVLSDYLFILPKVSNQMAVYTNALIWKPRSSNTYRIASAVSMDVNSGTPRSMAALRIN